MMDRIRRLRSEEGFTLIELLIVVIILAVLAAIVVFAVGTFPRTARQNACRTDFRSVETAQEARKADTGSYAPNIAGLVPTYLREAPPAPPATAEKRYGISTSTDGTTATVTVEVWAAASPPTQTGTTAAKCNDIG